LWSGRFGDEYTERNSAAGRGRKAFWKRIFSLCRVGSVLEVGCNAGANLEWIGGLLDPRRVFGVDVNQSALSRLRTAHPAVNALWGRARDLPFRDARFDMVFTTGVLIHQPPEVLPRIMTEIVRCSRRYVLCGEYFSQRPAEVRYRGQTGALFKRDFGALYLELFPELRLIKKGFLAKSRGGWDDVTFWVFEKHERER
jgi:pseudaminic acid biosynthesis-associated methylase